MDEFYLSRVEAVLIIPGLMILLGLMLVHLFFPSGAAVMPASSNAAKMQQAEVPQQAQPQACAQDVTMRRADQIAPEAVDWLWQGVIPYGDFTLLGGMPGMGKSQMAVSIAAKVTREGGGVLLFEGEDKASSAVVPRLIAAGAVRERVSIGDYIDLSNNIDALAAQARRLGNVRLVVLSPVRLAFKDAERFGNSGVRAAFIRLTEWAEKNRVAVLGIAHPPKSGRDPFAGSAGYYELSRSAWSIVTDPEDKNPIIAERARVLTAEKVSHGSPSKPMPFAIHGVELPNGIKTSKVVWL